MKFKLKFLNFFYLIFSVVAIAAYVLNSNSFMRATFNYKVDAELLYENDIDEAALEDLGITSEDLFSDLDTIIFEVEVNVGYGDLLKAWTETGNDYSYYNGSKYNAIERYSMMYILAPAFDNAPDWLEEDLTRVAYAAISKMIENHVRTGLESYSLETTGDRDYFGAMEESQDNELNLNELQFKGTFGNIADDLFRMTREDLFLNGYEVNGVTYYEGLKASAYPYFTAIKKPTNEDEQTSLTNKFNNVLTSISDCLYTFGVVDEDGLITDVREGIGTILQRLIDHSDYEDGFGGDYYDAPNSKFANKFFAPLKTYLEEDPEFENRLTEMFLNVIKNSNVNGGESNTLFKLIVIGARAFGVLLILFVLAWLIKFICCLISFFRQRAYVRINPLFIITGTLEALLALLTLGSVIIYNNFDIGTIRTTIPALQSIIPLGLSFQFIFACWIPGVLAILNLLFSIVYGPVKRKFKQDARDEILYSTDFNDYE